VGGKGALRKGDWKLVRDGSRNKPGPWMLFDLGNDIGEANDLADSEPEKLEELIKTWSVYDQQMIEPVF
jgi:arylsulfatase